MFHVESNIASHLSALASEIKCHKKDNLEQLRSEIFECNKYENPFTFPTICALAVLKSNDIGALSIINSLGGRDVMPSDDVTYFCKLFRMKNDVFASTQIQKLIDSAIDNTEAALFISQCAYYSIDHGINNRVEKNRFIYLLYNIVSSETKWGELKNE